MKPAKLTDDEIRPLLAALSGWTKVDDSIQRTYHFASFVKSMQFVNSLAETAEEIQHHPDIDIRYSDVKISLSTHDAGGLTQLDFKLATLADEYAESIVEA